MDATDENYCAVCRQNHLQGKKHRFSKGHQDAVKKQLAKFDTKLKENRAFLKAPMRIDISRTKPIWCIFCDCDISPDQVFDESLAGVSGAHIFEHLAGANHAHAMSAYFFRYGVDASRKKAFTMSVLELQQFKQRIISTGVVKGTPTQDNSVAYNPATDPYFGRDRTARTALDDEAPRTVEGAHHIMQNPSGYHLGQRVWGGGIVKYPPGSKQRLPWPIDFDDGATASTSHRTTLGVYDETEADAEESSRGMVTVEAHGENLTRINPAPLPAGYRNVHSGGTPPWMMQDRTEGETETVEQEATRLLAEVGKRKPRVLNPNRVGGVEKLNAKAQLTRGIKRKHSNDFLPNFGGLWGTGPRAQSQREYRAGRGERIDLEYQPKRKRRRRERLQHDESTPQETEARRAIIIAKLSGGTIHGQADSVE